MITSNGKLNETILIELHHLHPIGDSLLKLVANDSQLCLVAEYKAIHQTFGKVWGNFEDKVFADSEEGYNHFIENHPPERWDYWDI